MAVKSGKARPKSRSKAKTKSKRKSPRTPVGRKVTFPTASKLVKMQGFPKGSPWAISGGLLI